MILIIFAIVFVGLPFMAWFFKPNNGIRVTYWECLLVGLAVLWCAVRFVMPGLVVVGLVALGLSYSNW